MIVIPIKKGTKHYLRTFNSFIYRYGYQPIIDNEGYVSAVIEETRTRMSESEIRNKVINYCAKAGIPNEYNPVDYGY